MIANAAAFDFTFLDPFVSTARAPRPVNVFELSGFPRWETVASNVLAYFFDPNGQHAMGTIFVDALLKLLDGASPVGPTGVTPSPFNASDQLGSSEWSIVTEQATSDGMRIDIYLTNRERGIAVIVENKLDALVANPFESYARHALLEHSTTLSVVLSPSGAEDTEGRWTSRSLTYDNLFDLVNAALKTATGVDPRSADLLTQFIENTSYRRNQMDLAEETKTLESFWAAIEGKEASFVQFFGALDTVNNILRRRALRLKDDVLERLRERGLQPDDAFVVVGKDHNWGREEGLVAVVYLGFDFPDGRPSLELILGFWPKTPQYGFSVKAYSDRRYRNRCLEGFNHVPFDGVEYREPDSIVVDKFVALAERIGSIPGSGSATH